MLRGLPYQPLTPMNAQANQARSLHYDLDGPSAGTGRGIVRRALRKARVSRRAAGLKVVARHDLRI